MLRLGSTRNLDPSVSGVDMNSKSSISLQWSRPTTFTLKIFKKWYAIKITLHSIPSDMSLSWRTCTCIRLHKRFYIQLTILHSLANNLLKIINKLFNLYDLNIKYPLFPLNRKKRIHHTFLGYSWFDFYYHEWKLIILC